MRYVIVLVMMLSAGCSTQHFYSVHPASAVASCIASKWEQSGSGYKVPVVLEQQINGYFVGVAMPSVWHGIPSGAKHSNYPVWAEVTDTNSGSETTYRRAYQIFHGRIDQAVQKCQEPNQ